MTAPGLLRQFATFFGVGALATALHYAVLVALAEVFSVDPVAAALTGYCAGGLASYWLNRTRTFHSDRPHGEAGWRFAAVMAVGFALTWSLMTLFVDRLGLPYLPAQIVATGVVLVWNFIAHKWWTFRTTAGINRT
ncbi:MAG: polysaccharide synthesis protein GtrA [Rhizobiales bacterium 65-9]|nr:GtrA family protein [Hyphomicrobiales bacterium]OJY38761.1 MAG: polysaccharide synthesis protein GtrA [Rhizobiales bacterium 65-9]